MLAGCRRRYSLSHYIARGARCKHYMIEQNTEGQYQVSRSLRRLCSLRFANKTLFTLSVLQYPFYTAIWGSIE